MKHAEDLYDKENKPSDIEIEEEEVDDDIGPDLINKEIKSAIKDLKNAMIPGPDNIITEFSKSYVGDIKEKLKVLCKMIYRDGDWQEDDTKISIIPLRNQKVKCSENRIISLISYASKTLLRISVRRLKTKAEEYIRKDQFGF